MRGLLSALYFGIMKFALMPLHQATGHGQSFTWIFSVLLPTGETGFGAVLLTMGTNPSFTFGTLLVEEKFVYVLMILGPLLFLPLRHRHTWAFFVPAAMFSLLATGYKPLYQHYFQYTANWTANIFIATAITLSSWKALPGSRVRIAAALGAVLMTSAIFSYRDGATLQHNRLRGGFLKVGFEFTEKGQTISRRAAVGARPPPSGRIGRRDRERSAPIA